MNILIIPDGNRRWAKENGLSIDDGYRECAKKLAETFKWLKSQHISEAWVTVCTVKNLKRPLEQVSSYLKWFSKVQEFTSLPLGFTVSSGVSVLPEPYKVTYSLLPKAKDAEFTVHYLVGWSSDDELVRLVNKNRGAGSEATKEELINQSDIQQPIDLIVRSGKVSRLSAMIPWHSPYAEIFFVDKYWPGVTKDDFAAALDFFDGQQKREGL